MEAALAPEEVVARALSAKFNWPKAKYATTETS